MLERKIVEKYDTLEDLAKAAGIKPDALKAQVEKFNEVVKAKADPVWNRYINNDQVPLVEGPWYVCELQPKVHHCMGGPWSPTRNAACLMSARISRFRGFMPPVKRRAACTAQYALARLPFWTAWSTAA